jgi:hypothetical protein
MHADKKDPLSAATLAAPLWLASAAWRKKMLQLFEMGDWSSQSMFLPNDTVHGFLRERANAGLKEISFGAIRGSKASPGITQDALHVTYAQMVAVLFAYGGPVRSCHLHPIRLTLHM